MTIAPDAVRSTAAHTAHPSEVRIDRVTAVVFLGLTPQAATAAGTATFELGGIFWLLVWVIGLIGLGSGEARTVRRGVWLVWLVAPFIWLGLKLISDRISDQVDDRARQEAHEQFEASVERFVRGRQAITLNDAAIEPSDRPIAILVSYPGWTGTYGNPDTRSLMPDPADIATALARAPSECGTTRVREVQAVWNRDREEVLRRISICPRTFHDLEVRSPDAEFELILGKHHEMFHRPQTWIPHGSITAFSAEIHHRKSGAVLSSQTIFRASPESKRLEALDIGVQRSLQSLLSCTFPLRSREPAPGSKTTVRNPCANKAQAGLPPPSKTMLAQPSSSLGGSTGRP